MDVYIPRWSIQKKRKATNFVFIKYREEYEMLTTIRWKDQKRINGRVIMLKNDKKRVRAVRTGGIKFKAPIYLQIPGW